MIDLPTFQEANLPTHLDLPSEVPEGYSLFNRFQFYQSQFMRASFYLPNYPPEQILISNRFTICYDEHHPNWYTHPNWFLVQGVPRIYKPRSKSMSYMIWEEKVIPLIVVEIIRLETEVSFGDSRDENESVPPTSWEVYEQILQVPYCVVFNYDTDRLRVFKLVDNRYQELSQLEECVWLPELDLGLGLWSGIFDGFGRTWMRWFDTSGHWIPTLFEQDQLKQRQQLAELGQQQRAE